MDFKDRSESLKKSNIIDMALTFSAMLRLFEKGSKGRIASSIDRLFGRLHSVRERDDYEELHRSFCQWFIAEIRTARREPKNGKVKPSLPASYGQAAKVLDIVAKVYMYYCGMPSPEVARRLVPCLHGAVDTPMMKHLMSRYPTSHLKAQTIAQVDEATYHGLQELVARDNADEFRDRIVAVQWDDIMWDRLNR